MTAFTERIGALTPDCVGSPGVGKRVAQGLVDRNEISGMVKTGKGKRVVGQDHNGGGCGAAAGMRGLVAAFETERKMRLVKIHSRPFRPGKSFGMRFPACRVFAVERKHRVEDHHEPVPAAELVHARKRINVLVCIGKEQVGDKAVCKRTWNGGKDFFKGIASADTVMERLVVRVETEMKQVHKPGQFRRPLGKAQAVCGYRGQEREALGFGQELRKIGVEQWFTPCKVDEPASRPFWRRASFGSRAAAAHRLWEYPARWSKRRRPHCNG